MRALASYSRRIMSLDRNILRTVLFSEIKSMPTIFHLGTKLASLVLG